MQKVLTAAEMREVDRLTTEKYGIPSILLMENAAHAVARVITEKLGGSVKGKSILVLCGKGNNGGDGAALARILWAQGADVDVVLFDKTENTSGDARVNFEYLRRITGKRYTGKYDPFDDFDLNFLTFHEEADTEFFRKRYKTRRDPTAVVDALFGTGLSRPLGEEMRQVVISSWFEEKMFRDFEFLLVSLDMPSGLNSDSPEPVGTNVAADVTVTFTAPKIANIIPPSSSFNGELIIANIGTPRELLNEFQTQLYLTDAEDTKMWLYAAKFSDDSYKNKRGHTLLIAGSENYSGAAVLAGNSAMRSGVGLVTVVTPKSSKESTASRLLPEVIVRGVAETEKGAISGEAFDEIDDLLEKADSVAIGCGLSQDESTKEFVKKVVENRRQPTIVDADALNLLSPFAGFAANGERDVPLILTPHEGEFMRLLGTDDKDVIKDRVAAVRAFSQKHNVILVLKGERVLIGEPGGKVVVNPTGNAGLGKAGNGDTLTGIIAGFAAQAVQMKIDMFETVVAAVYIAGLAGDIAEKKYGKRVMTASDVRECLTEAFERLAGN